VQEKILTKSSAGFSAGTSGYDRTFGKASVKKLKFRCWDGMTLYFPSNVDNDVDIPTKDNYVLMLFTGLCDKNGKEIFEGDILKIWSESNKRHFHYYVKDIGWYFLEWGLISIPMNSPTDFNLALGDREIIGNIYENQEILRS
jgi:hypothetical protein